MKFLLGPLAMLRGSRGSKRDLRVLGKFAVGLVVLIFVFMVIFRVLMAQEGEETTWTMAFYWVLTVMSTLGFGDIVLHSDIGRIFTMVVLFSGMLLLLALLPFLFIELFYIPWTQAQKAARTPRCVPEGARGHVLFTRVEEIAIALRARLDRTHVPHYLVVSDPDEAQQLDEDGWNVMLGDHDLAETWRLAGIDRAALVAATGNDAHNSHVAFTVRETDERVPVVAVANDIDSIDVLELAGCSEVIHLAGSLGETFARRAAGHDGASHVVHEVDALLIAETNARYTDLVGSALRDLTLRETSGVTIAGIWEHGQFLPGRADLEVHEDSVLLLAGTREQVDTFDRHHGRPAETPGPVLILGGGRVGRATAQALRDQGLDYRVIEKVKGRMANDPKCLVGNAADRALLERAGLETCSSVVLTTHDDDTNVFLTLYCRRLRPDVQILSRATRPRNVATLHRAGADFVLSYAAMGANALSGHIDSSEVLAIAEGLICFRLEVPASIVGITLAESQLRPMTGVSVVAIEKAGECTVNPSPREVLEAGSKLLMIGDLESEERFATRFLI